MLADFKKKFVPNPDRDARDSDWNHTSKNGYWFSIAAWVILLGLIILGPIIATWDSNPALTNYGPEEFIAKDWIPGDFHNGLALVKQGESYGYINTEGEMVIPARYDYATPFTHSRAIVRKQGQYGMINPQGKSEIRLRYNDLHPYKNQLALASYQDKGYGFLDWEENVVIDFQYTRARSFVEDRAAVLRNGLWGFIDTKGNEMTRLQYQAVGDFAGGLAAVKVRQLWGFINKSGEMVINPRFERVLDTDFTLGWASVQDGTRIIRINTQGQCLEGC